jgi:LEA14-like dessication related protein
MRSFHILLAAALISGCVSLPQRDPLSIDIAGIEGLPSEGLELRLNVSIRVQNPNNAPVEFNGTAFDLDLNGRRLASGVSNEAGTIPRYGEAIITVPVTVSAFNAMRQILGFTTGNNTNEVSYRVRGKLEGGLLGTRRFSDEGTFTLNLAPE